MGMPYQVIIVHCIIVNMLCCLALCLRILRQVFWKVIIWLRVIFILLWSKWSEHCNMSQASCLISSVKLPPKVGIAISWKHLPLQRNQSALSSSQGHTVFLRHFKAVRFIRSGFSLQSYQT